MKAKKILLHFILTICFVFSLSLCTSALEVWDGTVADSYAGGSGTKQDPYLISDGQELAYLMYQINSVRYSESLTKGVYYKLTSDIYLNDLYDFDRWGTDEQPSNSWIPGGKNVNYVNYCFAGNFDGDGHTVYGMYIKGTEKYMGLFGRITNGSVSNLYISHSYVEGKTKCGILSGVLESYNGSVVISNVHISDSKIVGTSHIGGFFGSLEANYAPVHILRCSNSAYVTAKKNIAGGIAGHMGCYGYNFTSGKQTGLYSAIFRECVNHGTVSSAEDAGGIVGSSQSMIGPFSGNKVAVLYDRCINTGKISSQKNCGSLAGFLGPKERNESYDTGEFIEVVANDFTDCVGVSEDNIPLFGSTISTHSLTSTKLIPAEDISKKESYPLLDFSDVWSFIGGIPVLKKPGDSTNDGKLTPNSLIATLGIFTGHKRLSDFDKSIDFDNNGEFSLYDLNAYMRLMHGKASSCIIASDTAIVSSVKNTEGGYLADVYMPIAGKTRTDFFCTRELSVGDVVTVFVNADGKNTISERTIYGNVFKKGRAFDLSSPNITDAGFVPLSSYDSENGIIKLQGSEREYKLSKGTPILLLGKFASGIEGYRITPLSANTSDSDTNIQSAANVFVCANKDNVSYVLIIE